MEISFSETVKQQASKGNLFKEMLNLPPDERDREIAYWSLQYLEDYRCQKSPIPPREWDEMKDLASKPEFSQMKQESKDRFYRRYFAKESIKEFYAVNERIFSENVSNYKWLHQMLDAIPEEDIVNRNKVKDAIETYYGCDWSPYQTKKNFL